MNSNTRPTLGRRMLFCKILLQYHRKVCRLEREHCSRTSLAQTEGCNLDTTDLKQGQLTGLRPVDSLAHR